MHDDALPAMATGCLAQRIGLLATAGVFGIALMPLAGAGLILAAA